MPFSGMCANLLCDLLRTSPLAYCPEDRVDEACAFILIA